MTWPPPFPRIRALVADGANGGDDLVVTEPERAAFFHRPVVVEEKLDGANVSIWLDDRGVPQVATRGGPGAVDRAGQLGRLRASLASRSEDLSSLLAGDRILYGEWLWLTHGVAYNGLPDLLVGLDLWSEAAGFMTANDRDRELEGPSIPPPPRVFEGTLGSEARLRSLLGRSRFGSEAAEGLIVRIEANGRLQARAKILAPSFRPRSGDDWNGPRRENRVGAGA